MDDYTDGALTGFLECGEEEGEFTNRTCARVFVLERLLQKCPWRRRMGSSKLLHQWTFCIQGCGRCIVDGKGNHDSRSRGYRTFIPNDGDVAVRFPHTLRRGSLRVPFDQDGNDRLQILPVALVGNVSLEIEESRDSFGLHGFGHIVRKLPCRNGVLSLRVFKDKC